MYANGFRRAVKGRVAFPADRRGRHASYNPWARAVYLVQGGQLTGRVVGVCVNNNDIDNNITNNTERDTWNELPHDMRHRDSLHLFKTLMKTPLVKQVFYS